MSVEDHRPAAAAVVPAVRAGPVPGANRQALPAASAAHASPEQGRASAAGALARATCQEQYSCMGSFRCALLPSSAPAEAWASELPTPIAPDHTVRITLSLKLAGLSSKCSRQPAHYSHVLESPDASSCT